MTHEHEARPHRPIWKRFFIGLGRVVLKLLGVLGGVLGVTVFMFAVIYLALVVTLFFLYNGWDPFRSLPTDEAMIAHFHAHRTDFEQLVEIYREYPLLPNRVGTDGDDEPLQRIKTIMDRIKVTGMRQDGQIWLPPDPYSPRAREKAWRSGPLGDAYRRGVEGRRYTGVLLAFSHEPVRRWADDFARVEKGYYYVPFPARVENGRFRKPDGGARVVPTLNSYPPELLRGTCVYRQFEPHWFIEVCQRRELHSRGDTNYARADGLSEMARGLISAHW